VILRFFFCGLLFLLVGCGDDGRRQDLTIVPQGPEFTIPVPTLSQGAGSVALRTNEEELLVAWIQGIGVERREVRAQRFHGDFEKLADEERLSDDSGDAKIHLDVCYAASGWDAVWTDVLPRDFSTTDIQLDLANVMARWGWPPLPGAPLRVNSNILGSQQEPRIACTGNGRRMVTWSNNCVAAQRVGSGILFFSPPECEEEPADGSLFQIFAPGGEPIGEPVSVSEGRPARVPVAAPRDGSGFVLLVGSTIQSRSDSGTLLDERHEPGVDFSTASIACERKRCLAAVAGNDSLRVWLIDPRSLATTSTITVKQTEEFPPNRITRLTDASTACEEGGVCIVTWRLLSETWDDDTIFTEPMGTYARALSLNDGEMGPEVMIHGPESADSGVLAAAQGRGRFAIARATAGGIVLSQLQVR
jgi:hypothetical protein